MGNLWMFSVSIDNYHRGEKRGDEENNKDDRIIIIIRSYTKPKIFPFNAERTGIGVGMGK